MTQVKAKVMTAKDQAEITRDLLPKLPVGATLYLPGWDDGETLAVTRLGPGKLKFWRIAAEPAITRDV